MYSLRFFSYDSRVDSDDIEDITIEVYIYGYLTIDILNSSTRELSA